MHDGLNLSRSDLRVLFWIVGCRTGATLTEIQAHEHHERAAMTTAESIQASLSRLELLHWIHLDGNRYCSDPGLQQEFLNACSNCRDTVEEIDILRRIIGRNDQKQFPSNIKENRSAPGN